MHDSVNLILLALVASMLISGVNSIGRPVSIFGTTVGPGFKREVGFGRYHF